GADFILTQPIYEIQPALKFLERIKNEIEGFNTPLLVGVLPLVSARHAAFLQHEVPGVNIPQEIHDRMTSAGERAAQTGIEIAFELIQQMAEIAQGIYLMPAFNRFDYAAEIIERVRKMELPTAQPKLSSLQG
ncbi:MAG TPA: bifunctional homocysteine S-methyltransferase/methylenetetrahydrofolate reductase, partial [Anaerolineaceae bacterium]|nr:bifunctional homocysteine S-methyltransferase/methylenetetrahydrofolate reductase [Anaerolineaceae bacterium]